VAEKLFLIVCIGLLLYFCPTGYTIGEVSTLVGVVGAFFLSKKEKTTIVSRKDNSRD
jgi:hypothetical protein